MLVSSHPMRCARDAYLLMVCTRAVTLSTFSCVLLLSLDTHQHIVTFLVCPPVLCKLFDSTTDVVLDIIREGAVSGSVQAKLVVCSDLR
jgi:hypothetical protein